MSTKKEFDAAVGCLAIAGDLIEDDVYEDSGELNDEFIESLFTEMLHQIFADVEESPTAEEKQELCSEMRNLCDGLYRVSVRVIEKL